jgi:DNA-binding SARP family transcriptional activator
MALALDGVGTDPRSAGLRVVPVRLSLLGGFSLGVDGRLLELPVTSVRVLAFLALHRRPLHRLHVSGTLWPNATEEHAGASLRSALWRLRRLGLRVIECTGDRICLTSEIHIDFQDVVARSRRVIDASGGLEAADVYVVASAGDLLPDFYDDWLLLERERFRQLRVHALEALCDRLTAVGRFAEAVDAGMAAITIEPTRESGHRALIRAHLAEGNVSEAVRQYKSYVRLAANELGIEPSPAFQRLGAELPLR